MCGRYSLHMPPELLKKHLGLEVLLNIPARFNAAPTQSMPVIVRNRMGLARWGLSPPWLASDKTVQRTGFINARSESVAEKPAFRESWVKKRRCIVPANGFYEWSSMEGVSKKQPFYIYNKNDALVCFAGLWSKVDDCVSFAILTKQADGNLSHLHHRSPVLVNPEQFSDWFNGDESVAFNLIDQSKTFDLSYHPVSHEVGRVANDFERLIDAVEPEVKKERQTDVRQGALL